MAGQEQADSKPLHPLPALKSRWPGFWAFVRWWTNKGWLRVFTTGSYMVVQLRPSQQPLVAFGFVPLPVSRRWRKLSFNLVHGNQQAVLHS